MDIRKNVEALISSDITAHEVSSSTGLSRTTIYRIFTGETALESVSFGKMEKLALYYEEMLKNGRKDNSKYD